jgi:hypothetical protein
MNKGLLFLILFIGFNLPPLPAAAGGVVTFPAGNTACSVKVTLHKNPPLPPASDETPDPSKNPAIPEKVNIFRSNMLLLINVTKMNKETIMAWCPGVLNLTIFKDSQNPRLNSTQGNYLFPSVFYLDRNHLWYSWADPESLKEAKVKMGGASCNRYQKTVRTPSPAPGFPEGTATYQLWVNDSSLLPVAFDDGEALYELEFKPPPAEPPVIPAEVQNEIKRYEVLLAPPRRS